MSSLAERLAAARRQAEQAAQGDSAAGPDAAGAAGPGPTEAAPTPRVRRTQGSPVGTPPPRTPTVAARPPRAAAVRPRRSPSRRPGAAEAARSRSGSTSSRVTCTPSWSSSSVRTCTPPTSTRPTSRAASGRCWATSSRARTARSATPTGPKITQEISDDILGYGPIEPFLRDVDVSEVMVNAHDQIYLEKDGTPPARQGPVQRRGPPAPHDRQDRVPHRPPRRRVQPHGRRPPPRRQPCQRGHPAAVDRRLLA